MENGKYTEAEKRQAAYALNMCTVSVSQIIDYHDSFIMEQEYEAILNNLNLKHMPKDEALLRILSELLNTVTFFRIQELKKAQIEAKYEQRMKNAIWSAVPSLNVIVSGNPAAIVLAAVTQIGSGYMNYRKEKAGAGAEKKDAEVELEITAIEQLNGLRRELFTTAWRLADEYDFADEWRLTEKQIRQYNDILMDADPIRKYERLDAIKDKFEAYPPFWYFLGNAANMIATDPDFEQETKETYRKAALSCFKKYEEVNKDSLLREDMMAASCALEHVELLVSSGNYDRSEVLRLISGAAQRAEKAFDNLEVCALTYLKLDEPAEAARLLRILVNEDYNKIVNAQLLSGIYVRTANLAGYELLKTRVAAGYLFPMAQKGEDPDTLQALFESQQKQVLKAKYREVLTRIIDKYSAELNQDISVFDLNEEYEDDFFANTGHSKKVRMIAAKGVFLDEKKKDNYLERLSYVSLAAEYTEIFERMYHAIFENAAFCDPVLKGETIQRTYTAIGQYREGVQEIQKCVDLKTFTLRDYEKLQKIGIYTFVKDSFNFLYQQICKKIDGSQMDDLYALEGHLMSLCEKLNLAVPEIAVHGGEYREEDGDEGTEELFDIGIFGSEAVVAKNNVEYLNSMTDFIRDKMKTVSVGDEMEVYYRGDTLFERYFNDSIFEKYPSLKPHSLMILKDRGKEMFDLIFTTEGIVHVTGHKVRKKTPYEDVVYSEGSLELFGKRYRKTNIDTGALFEIAKGIDRTFINNLDQKIEYIGGEVTAKLLNEWFRNHPDAMADGVQKVYAWPRKDLLNSMGYHLEKELDKEFYLLQFYYDIQTGGIIRLRIVEFDRLDKNFKELLRNKGGILKVEEG